MDPAVLLYRYDTSPFCHKVDNILLLKNIPHSRVNVASMLPRPEITEMLGIGYRKIPILAIGNDVYCDTSLIASTLERRFPKSQDFGTLFPPQKHSKSADTGLIKAFAKHWVDMVIFPLAPALLPWERMPAAFVQDRSALSGNEINIKAIAASRGQALSALSSHLALVEEQLSDGREWLFDTTLPSLADISVHFVFAWLKGFKGTETLLDSQVFPKSIQWLARVTTHLEHLKQKQPVQPKISGNDAAAAIISAPFESLDVVGMNEREASRLGLKAGAQVSVTPADSGRNYPTVGKLVGLNHEELVIEINAPGGILRAHFPRILFTVKPVSAAPKL
ncbi:Glutathione S-transferase [Mycena kentingensis (nom. inval.)]|nr:Glutathione S-transferase [Mycena kentingensis (nom. inval.)]